MNALLSIKLDVPNLNNQKKILSQIDNQLKKIDELTDKKHEKVDLLHELKSRLISDVVTGQIDVRDVKVPDFEYIEEEFDEDLDEDPADSDFENEED
jgi:type I restriction enzyme S subunit